MTLCTSPSRPRRTRSASVSAEVRAVPLDTTEFRLALVEYTPETHNATDFDVFFANYSKSQIGERPTLFPIDGGKMSCSSCSCDPSPDLCRKGVHTTNGDLGESSLDLQYVLGLIGTKRQEVQLFQVGDPIEGPYAMKV
ncbi:hypothetical protein OH77DRAFT_1432541 [Trametes cingulata]|nr:hypothetical protein OH77DRAFT_1432541 [Trametes cingulata]